MSWWFAWRIDRNPPERILAKARSYEEAWAQITNMGELMGRVQQHVYGPFDSEQDALEAPADPPPQRA